MSRRIRTAVTKLSADFEDIKANVAPWIFRGPDVELRSITRYFGDTGKLSSIVIKGRYGDGLKWSAKVKFG